MNINKKILIIILIAIIMQNIAFTVSCQNNFYYTFAVGLNAKHGTILNLIPVFYLICPIVVQTYLFCEEVYKLRHGYGKLLIVRSYSKSKLIIISVLRSLVLFIVFTILQFILYSVSNNTMIPISIDSIIKSVLIYVLVNINIILVEYLIGQFFTMQLSALITILYVGISCCLGYVKNLYKFKILFFPCLMFGGLNGSLYNPKAFISNVFIMIIIMLILMISNIIIFRKKDIF